MNAHEEKIKELELLAKWRWYIEGNGFDPTKEKAHREPCVGRPELIDEKHEEVAIAMKTREALQRLRASGKRGQKQAELLQKHFVEKGSEARKLSVAPKHLSMLERVLWDQQQQKQLAVALRAYQKNH